VCLWLCVELDSLCECVGFGFSVEQDESTLLVFIDLIIMLPVSRVDGYMGSLMTLRVCVDLEVRVKVEPTPVCLLVCFGVMVGAVPLCVCLDLWLAVSQVPVGVCLPECLVSLPV
jgi:hypothetical protein